MGQCFSFPKKITLFSDSHHSMLATIKQTFYKPKQEIKANTLLLFVLDSLPTQWPGFFDMLISACCRTRSEKNVWPSSWMLIDNKLQQINILWSKHMESIIQIKYQRISFPLTGSHAVKTYTFIIRAVIRNLNCFS